MSRGRIFVFPYWNDNAYIDIIYMAADSRGFSIVKTYYLQDLEKNIESAVAGDVVHIHWTTRICQEAESEEAARNRLDSFKDIVRRAKSRGAKLVWTIHNTMAHDAKYEDLEIELYRLLAAESDGIHVMNPRTPEFVSGDFELEPGKIVSVPHPSYRGWYDNTISRTASRQQLGVPEDARVVLFFGNIKPYKGVLELVDALKVLKGIDPKAFFLLAGRVSEADRLVIEKELSDGIPHVKHFGYVDAKSTSRWFIASDLIVVPYRRSLNSGTLQLAASFDLPALVPDQDESRAVYGAEAWVSFYESTSSPRELAYKIASELRQSPLRREAAYEFSRQYPPFVMSNDLSDYFDKLVDAV